MLREELFSGPLSTEILPFITDGNDGAIAEIMNTPRYEVFSTVSRDEFTIWSASTGMRSSIQDHADSTNSPLRDTALALIDVLRGSAQGIDFSRSENLALLNAWVLAGVLSESNRDMLLALSKKSISRAEQLLGHNITAQDVAQALRP